MDESLREQLTRIYAETKTIAVVGISRYPFKPSQRIRSTCRSRATASGR